MKELLESEESEIIEDENESTIYSRVLGLGRVKNCRSPEPAGF